MGGSLEVLLMRILDFVVTKQKIERDPMCDFTGIAPGSRGYLYARFRFSADWKGCKKVVVFSGRGEEECVPLTNGMCEIPAKVLIGNTVGVTVVGECDEYRIPTNKISFQQRRV